MEEHARAAEPVAAPSRRLGLRTVGGLTAGGLAIPVCIVIAVLRSQDYAAQPFAVLPLTALAAVCAGLAGALRARAALRSPWAAWLQMAFLTMVFGIAVVPWLWAATSSYIDPVGMYLLTPAAFLIVVFSGLIVAVLVGAALWAWLFPMIVRDSLGDAVVEAAKLGVHRDGVWATAAVVVTVVMTVIGFAQLSSIFSNIGY